MTQTAARRPPEKLLKTTQTASYDDLQWRMLKHFANSECDDMDVEAMAWAVREIERLRSALMRLDDMAARSIIFAPGDGTIRALDVAGITGPTLEMKS